MTYSMVDVGEKPATFRRAVAQGVISLGETAYAAVRDKLVPKGDPLSLAEVAGIQAAKRTPDLLPLCHPLILDRVGVSCELLGETREVRVRGEVSGTGKTGFEMEALTAVSAALLCIYDLLKGIEPALAITSVRLVEKEGGKHGHWVLPEALAAPPLPKAVDLSGIRAAILVVSDRVFAGRAVDEAGKKLAGLLALRGAVVEETAIVADEREAIAGRLRHWARQREIPLLLVTGGTGLGPRDVTPEAVQAVCERLIPGLGEKLRADGARHTPLSWLSRQVAGLVGHSLVIAFPGSPKAVDEGWRSLEPLLPHALHIARGGNHEKQAER